jgi:hypothetical protein
VLIRELAGNFVNQFYYMKKLLLLAFSTSLSFGFAQSGLTNLNFETTSAFSGMGCSSPTPFPTGFNRSSAGINGSAGVNYSLTPTAQSGTTYITIGNVNTCGHVDLQPISFNMNGGNTPGNGSPYINKPASFCGYYRTQGLTAVGDSVFVLVYLTKNGTLVGKGKYASGTNQASWTNFCANINYISALTPDTIRIRFTPSGLMAASQSSFTSQTMIMDIDNCSFTGTATAVSELASNIPVITTFPNPASDKLNIHSTCELPLIANFYNLLGQKEKTATITNGKNSVNTSDLANGVYIIQYKDQDKVISQNRIIISH